MKTRDPFAATIVVLIAIAVAGLATIGLAFRSMRNAPDVSFQVSYAVSGVIGGLAVVGFAVGLLAIQTTRRREATERAEFDRLVFAAAELLATARRVMRIVRALVASGIVAASLAWALPARAQIPELPAQLDPVFELVGPVTSKACDEAGSAFQLLPVIYSAYTGMPLPSQLLTLFGPVIVVCGSLPPIDPGKQLECKTDATVHNLLTQIADAAGQSLPTAPPALLSPLASTVFVIQDKLPNPVKASLPISPIIATAFDCVPVNSKTPTQPIVNPEPTDSPANDSADFTDDPPSFDFPFDDGLVPDLPDVNTDLGAVDLPRSRTPLLSAVGTGFAYPVVFALPLVILVIGGFLGRALTQPLAPSGSRPTPDAAE